MIVLLKSKHGNVPILRAYYSSIKYVLLMTILFGINRHSKGGRYVWTVNNVHCKGA